MKTHSTNYQNTLIEIAEDSARKSGEMPPIKGDAKTVANLQFDMLYDNPYKYSSDDVLFDVYAVRQGFPKNELDEERAIFFSKGQPCFRTSPLTKSYGWGIHSDENGKIAMYSADSKEYQNLLNDDKVKKVKAMKNKR